MATQLKLRSDIKKLKKAIETKGISVSIKDKLKLQLEKAENELATLKSTGKAPKKSSVAGTKTALTSLQKLVQKNKKYAKYRGAGVDLKKDAGEPALKTGRRESKGLKANQYGSAKENKGNVYYEYRPNRLDVKQPPKRYPKLEEGGIMADGGSTDVVNAEISTIRTNIMGTISFLMKIKGMKKPQEFIVYPISADQAGKPIMIQSDTRIGVLDLSSGSGLMSQSHPNGAYGHHFQMDKKVPFKINETDLQRLKDKISDTAGSSVGTKGIISDNSGANMMASGGYMAKGGETGRIVMIPTYVVKEIKESVEMGYDTLVEGMIGRKRRGVALINQDYQVRGTYDIGLKDAIEDLIKKIKAGNFKVDAVDKKASGGMMADGGNFVLRWQDPKNGGQEEEFSSKKDAIEFVKELYKYKDFLRYADKYEIPRLYDDNNKEVIDAYELQYLAENSGRIMADGGMMADGGLIAYSNNDYENKIGSFQSLESAKKFAKANKWKYDSITFEDESGDNIVVSKDDSFKDIDWLFSDKMADGGMMAKGGIYSSDSLYILTISKDGKIIGHEPFRAKNMKEAREIAEDMEEKYTSKHGKDLEFTIKEAMASGGMMADGGGINDEGQLKVINLGGDRYDGGLFYEIRKESVVQRGTIDGEEKIKYHGKEYDGLKSLAEGIGAKLVIIPEEMKHGGVLSHNHKLD